ncbi:MAG TPA: LysM peptidoglycan-binding domain-containing protein [Anaerolineales bacterium]|nr:LysM peptidoglycan-binding domain-containing protein [Anaerolineales bacterium]
MLKRPPTDTSNTINSFRKKRQQQGQFLMYGAIALVVLGLILLIYWLTRPEMPLGQYFATETPTVTVTATATNTSTPTLTATITETPTITLTATPSEPFLYTIQEGDSLEALSQRFNLGPDGPLLIYYQNQQVMEQNGGVIFVGQTITIPLPGSVLPTTTPIPPNLRAGTLIDYTVLPGDTLAGIAFKFNSIADNIIEENEITDPNALQSGDVLRIPVNLVTPTATLPSTSTPVSPTAPAGQATSTPAAPAATSAPGGTASTAACSFDENAQFVTQLQTLINDERTTAGLPALTVNTQLSTAAKDHAVDMLCNDYLSHIGLDGSTPEDRVREAGFTASLVLENLYALHPAYGGNPQSAFDWWMSDADSKADLLNANTTVVGIAYVTSDDSLLGGYFVVLSARP